jgi:threonine-phosphate decarboxylase
LKQPAWSVSRQSQVVGHALLAETGYQEFTRRFVAECRAELTAELQAVPGVRVFPSAANFLLLRIERAGSVAARLRQRGIVVRVCDSFTGLQPDAFLRVAVRKRSENQRLVEALHAAR